MSAVAEWARVVKPDLVSLQVETGIPALWSCAQMAHEAFDHNGIMTPLAFVNANFGGLKWADWQAQYGCKPVVYGTWEEVGGNELDTDAAFCGCPSWAVWLKVYAHLLTHYGYENALRYKADPLLYGYHIWRNGYATDSRYLGKVAAWLSSFWHDYVDTLAEPALPVTVKLDNQTLSEYHINASEYTVGPLRPFLDELKRAGYAVEWDGLARTLAVSSPQPVAVRIDKEVVECGARLEGTVTRVNLKPFAHALGARVGWSQRTRTVDVGTRGL